MNTVVAKFGGSSLADATQFRKVISIIKSDSRRKVIIVSAPGKRYPEDEKITDLLYTWQRQASQKLPYQEYMDKVWRRFEEIVSDLGLSFNVSEEIQRIEFLINTNELATPAYAASRGEYLCAQIMAEALGFRYVPAEDCLLFGQKGKLPSTYADTARILKYISNDYVVIPGFYYGAVEKDETVRIKTFSRGGSDLTGAIIAQAIDADLYENWTDVSGLLMCDPRIVSNPLPITEVTYRELRELSYMGANVFHEEAMFPVQRSGIPTNIRNTNNPDHPGTFLRNSIAINSTDRVITGIAGRQGFVVITVEKMLMNQEIGFARKILSILERLEISFEHMPGGIDTLSIIVDEKSIKDVLELVIRRIKRAVMPDNVKVSSSMAMIAVVGRGMASTPGIAAKIFSGVAARGINIQMINQGSSELSIILGVQNSDYEKAIQAIYASVVE